MPAEEDLGTSVMKRKRVNSTHREKSQFAATDRLSRGNFGKKNTYAGAEGEGLIESLSTW